MAHVVVVGAGPGGMFASHLLSQHGVAVTLLEMGADIEARLNALQRGGSRAGPDYIQGMGGSGMFSDGKMNLSPEIGGNMLEFVSRSDAEALIDHVDALFVKHGMDAESVIHPEAEDLKRRAYQTGIRYIPIRQKHVGSDHLPRIVRGIRGELLDNGVAIRVGRQAVDLVVDKTSVKGVIAEHGGLRETIEGDYVVLAPGRAGSRWLLDLATRYAIPYVHGPLDIGVRVEVADEVMAGITAINWDPKFHIRTPKYDDFVRTFCTNPGGFVITENYGKFVSVNGHSMKDRSSRNTNFALLVRIYLTKPVENTTLYGESICRLATTIGGGKPLLQRLEDLNKGRRSTWERIEKSYIEPTNKDVTPGDLSIALPARILEDIVEGLGMLAQIIPGVDQGCTLIYGPEVKFKSVRLDITRQMETRMISNLFTVGDGAGVSGGIVTASVTGLIAAREILRRAGKPDVNLMCPE